MQPAPGQPRTTPRHFASVALASLGGVLLVLLRLNGEPGELLDWLSLQLLLSLPLFILALATQLGLAGLNRRLAPAAQLLMLLLVLATGLTWGSLLALVAAQDVLLPAVEAFWVTLLISLLVALAFRGLLIQQLAWLAMVFLPLVFFLALEDVITDGYYLQVMLVVVALVFLQDMFPSTQVKEPEKPTLKAKVDDSAVEVLQHELNQLQIAFAAQDSAIQAETALRQAVEESLREANRLAEAANHSKTEFMATVGHEIRTPLNGILPILEMLEATPLDEDQAQLVKTASHSSRHLLRIINDVLDFSKAEVGKLEIESLELELHELVYSVTDLMRQAAVDKGLLLKVNIAPQVPEFVRGDTLRLKQILTNLLGNALKFTEQGEISLEVTLRHEHVREVEIMVTVRDTGIGMSPETTTKLFRSFTQADASTTRTHGGTGLGLAICKRLVELMGGEIGVKSVQGKGSTFWFVLPMRKSLKVVPALREDAADARLLFYSRSREKTAEDLRHIQQDCQISIEVSHDLDQAVDCINQSAQPGERNFYDLVVIDVLGHEAAVSLELSTLKRYLQNSFTQLMVINALPHQVQVCKQAGADAVLIRPFRTENFRQRVYRLLDIDLNHGSAAATDEQNSLQMMLLADELTDMQLPDKTASPADSGLVRGHVLLVEDNPVNLAVARRMLQLLGMEVEVAKDGARALEMMKTRPLDLVFMDCLMPVMDGFEATRQWRAFESSQPDSGHLPIVAMTANAMRGDREKCLAASMDDYLPKPLTRPALVELLSRWLQGIPPAGADGNGLAGQAATEQTNMAEPAAGKALEPTVVQAATQMKLKPHNGLLDEQVLNELQDVMGNDFSGVIFSYLQHASQLLTEMKHRAEAGDTDSVLRSAHSFKSSSKNVGAMALGEQARLLEERLRAGESVDLKPAVQGLVVAYDEVARALKDYT